MNEATSALNHELKIIMEKMIKKRLPNAAVVLIDHNLSNKKHKVKPPRNGQGFHKFIDKEIDLGMSMRR